MAVEGKATPKYLKAQILESNKFLRHRDLLTVLLKDELYYTEAQVNALIKKYLKGAIN